MSSELIPRIFDVDQALKSLYLATAEFVDFVDKFTLSDKGFCRAGDKCNNGENLIFFFFNMRWGKDVLKNRSILLNTTPWTLTTGMKKRENYLTSPSEYFFFLVIGSSPSSIKSSDAFEMSTV